MYYIVNLSLVVGVYLLITGAFETNKKTVFNIVNIVLGILLFLYAVWSSLEILQIFRPAILV